MSVHQELNPKQLSCWSEDEGNHIWVILDQVKKMWSAVAEKTRCAEKHRGMNWLANSWSRTFWDSTMILYFGFHKVPFDLSIVYLLYLLRMSFHYLQSSNHRWEQICTYAYPSLQFWRRTASSGFLELSFAWLEQWLRQSSLQREPKCMLTYIWQLQRSSQISIIWAKNVVATFIDTLDIAEITFGAW